MWKRRLGDTVARNGDHLIRAWMWAVTSAFYGAPIWLPSRQLKFGSWVNKPKMIKQNMYEHQHLGFRPAQKDISSPS